MEHSSDKIRIVVINGSARPRNYTAMASALVVDELKKHPKVAVEVIDPASLNLPFPGTDSHPKATQHLQQRVAHATGIVLATPEYHGSFSSVMKLVIENLGYPSALEGKPIALLGVAAGSIGAIKSLEHLRGVVSHVGALALPLPVSVPNVRSVFDSDGRCLEPAVEVLVRGVAVNLLKYIEEHLCPKVTLERILRERAPQRPSEAVPV